MLTIGRTGATGEGLVDRGEHSLQPTCQRLRPATDRRLTAGPRAAMSPSASWRRAFAQAPDAHRKPGQSGLAAIDGRLANRDPNSG